MSRDPVRYRVITKGRKRRPLDGTDWTCDTEIWVSRELLNHTRNGTELNRKRPQENDEVRQEVCVYGGGARSMRNGPRIMLTERGMWAVLSFCLSLD